MKVRFEPAQSEWGDFPATDMKCGDVCLIVSVPPGVRLSRGDLVVAGNDEFVFPYSEGGMFTVRACAHEYRVRRLHPGERVVFEGE